MFGRFGSPNSNTSGSVEGVSRWQICGSCNGLFDAIQKDLQLDITRINP